MLVPLQWIRNHLKTFAIVLMIIVMIYKACIVFNGAEIGLQSEKTSFDEILKNYVGNSVTSQNITHGISILIVSDQSFKNKFSQFSAALFCYAMSHAYAFTILDTTASSSCAYIPNFFFRKHCLVLHHLSTHPEINWLMVLDGDNLLVNASKQIENYLPNTPDVYVVHMERFYNGEISAGNYLIYNCEWSHRYLINWINLYRDLPQVHYHNNDNGALHIHFALSVGKVPRTCYTLWHESVDETSYDRYVGCIKCAIGGQRRFQHVWLLRRGHGFVRDYREPENMTLFTDFIIHGFKHDPSFYYMQNISIDDCQRNIGSWKLPIRSTMLVTDQTIARGVIRYHDYIAQLKHPLSVGIADVHDCWPSCDSNIGGWKEHRYLETLCMVPD